MIADLGGCTVVIPSFRPPPALPALARELVQAGFRAVYIVDDGSPMDGHHIFAECSRLGATVVTHPINQGKGSALKTGIRTVLTRDPGTTSLVFCDDDGQHLPSDVKLVAQEGIGRGFDFLMGVRNFSGNTPWRSLIGNRLSTILLKLRHGLVLPDCQSGLRYCDRRIAEELLSIPGDGFAFETNVLLERARSQRHTPTIPVSTVYLAGNRHTRFRAFADSWDVLTAMWRSK